VTNENLADICFNNGCSGCSLCREEEPDVDVEDVLVTSAAEVQKLRSDLIAALTALNKASRERDEARALAGFDKVSIDRDLTWMALEDALSHYACAMESWKTTLDERDALRTDRDRWQKESMEQALALWKLTGERDSAIRERDAAIRERDQARADDAHTADLMAMSHAESVRIAVAADRAAKEAAEVIDALRVALNKAWGRSASG